MHSIPSPSSMSGGGVAGSLGSSSVASFSSTSSTSSIPFPSPSLSSSSSSSLYSFSCHDSNTSVNPKSKASTTTTTATTTTTTTGHPSSRLDEIKRDKAIHNTLEKNRRAHLKDCFERLQNELPPYKDKKVTNLLILNYTLKYVEEAKRKERDCELSKQRLLKRQQHLRLTLRNLLGELERTHEGFDTSAWLRESSSSHHAHISSEAILNVDTDSMDRDDRDTGMDDSFGEIKSEHANNNNNNNDDESAASTSTASGNYHF